jgi:large subunit ribosomal protein L29
MKFKEINDQTDEQITKLLVEKKRHLFDLRTQSVTEKLEDPTQLGKTKKDIARIQTVIRSRQIATTTKQQQQAQTTTK